MANIKPLIDHAELVRILDYNPATGVFVWRVATCKKVVPGKVAGAPNPSGYITIGIGGRSYYAHRLAWFYMTEMWPPRGVDHRDTVPGNNAWANLRLATKSQNGSNRGPPRTNTSGVKGVYWHAKAGKWCAFITALGRYEYLGIHENLEDAKAVRVAAEIRLQGEYARGQ